MAGPDRAHLWLFGACAAVIVSMVASACHLRCQWMVLKSIRLRDSVMEASPLDDVPHGSITPAV